MPHTDSPVQAAQHRAHTHFEVMSLKWPNKAIRSEETDHPSPSKVCLNRKGHQALRLCECAVLVISRGG